MHGETVKNKLNFDYCCCKRNIVTLIFYLQSHNLRKTKKWEGG